MQTAEDILNYYINKARRYERLNFISEMYCYRVHKLVLENWYREATFVYQLACTFEDFVWLINNKSTVLYKNYRWKPKKFSWSWNHEQRHRVCRKYKRQPHHKKKELSEHEIAKRDWRKFKYDSRDQKFHKKYRGATSDFKFYNKRGHRAFEKKCISNGQYDKLHDRTWKQVEDWWSWD